MTDIQRRVLVSLARVHHADGNYRNFRGICSDTGLDRNAVRLACRALRRRGYARFSNALWDDDGPAGAGYASTDAGYALVQEDVYADEG